MKSNKNNDVLLISLQIRNYFISTGYHSQGITFGGSVGGYLADWIVDGKPSKLITSFDVTRFAPVHNQLSYVKARTVETEGSTLKKVENNLNS